MGLFKKKPVHTHGFIQAELTRIWIALDKLDRIRVRELEQRVAQLESPLESPPGNK